MEEKLRGRFLLLSANAVNHAPLSSVHARLGALLPFQALPDGVPSTPWALPEGLPAGANVLDDTSGGVSKSVPSCCLSAIHC